MIPRFLDVISAVNDELAIMVELGNISVRPICSKEYSVTRMLFRMLAGFEIADREMTGVFDFHGCLVVQTHSFKEPSKAINNDTVLVERIRETSLVGRDADINAGSVLETNDLLLPDSLGTIARSKRR